jgi:hypothetical protein
MSRLLLLISCGVSSLTVFPCRAASIGGSLPEPERPAWMAADAKLQMPVTVSMNGQPLRTVLEAITKGTGVDLRATRDLQEFRVTLSVERQSLGHVMGRLLDLFGHGKLPNRGCYWERIAEGDHPPRYVLRRTLRGIREEEALLDYPTATAARWLRDLRDYARLSPESRKKFKSDWPKIQQLSAEGTDPLSGNGLPVTEAVAAMNDDQIDVLTRTGHVDLPDYRPSAACVSELRDIARTYAPPGEAATPQDADPPSGATLRMEAGVGEGHFGMYLSFQTGYPRDCNVGFSIDTLGLLSQKGEEDALIQAASREEGPDIDLFAHDVDRESHTPTLSLKTALSLIAREAKIPIYAEIFLKSRRALRYTRGKPEYLLSRICQTLGCDWRKISGEYVIWSKTWAQDRAADVPQPLLDRWAARRMVQGRFELPDVLEIARLTDRQIPTALTYFDQPALINPRNSAYLKLLAGFSTTERQAAYREEGIVLGRIDERKAQLLRQVFRREQVVGPIHLRLKTYLTGVGIDLTDAVGVAPGGGGWIFLGAKNAPPETFVTPVGK